MKFQKFKHWTPRYIVNRINVMLTEKLHPDWPWLTKKSISMLSQWLNHTHKGFEWGSGRSTLWFAKRVRLLVSVEHSLEWYNKTSQLLSIHNVSNVKYSLHRIKEEDENPANSSYVQSIHNFHDEYFDFVLVDGILRDYCAYEALRKIRKGGLLIIDNINWYFPSRSVSPNSKKFSNGFSSKQWEAVYKHLKSWRYLWTSNGVTDTVIYIKPYE